MQLTLDVLAAVAAPLSLFLLRASALLSIAWAATYALRRASAATRAWVWRAAFVGVALLPLISELVPPLPGLARSSGNEATATTAHVARAEALGWRAMVAVSSLPEAAPIEVAGAPFVVEAAEPVTSDRIASGWLEPLLAALVVVWTTGALGALYGLWRGLARSAQIVRRSRPLAGAEATRAGVSRLRVLESDAPEAPFVWDLRPFASPAIVLAAEAVQSRGADWKRSVMLHELQHVARRDGLVLVLARVVSAFAWPTPLIWLALRALRCETERACDDAVLRAGVRPSEYASLLVGHATVSAPSLPVPAMVSHGPLTARIGAILAPGVKRHESTRLERFTIAACGGVALTAVAACGAARSELKPIPPAEPMTEPAVEDPRAALLNRGIGALLAMYDAEVGAWRGDVGSKFNSTWRITAANAPHVGVTALAVEALVAAGVRPGVGSAGAALERGVQFLLRSQDPAGFVSAHGTRMRDHAHTIRAWASVLRAAGDSGPIRNALERAMEFTRENQNAAGGWRFTPGSVDSDIQETTYQLDALRTALITIDELGDEEMRATNERLYVPVFERGVAYIATCRLLEGVSWGPGVGAYRFETDDRSRVDASTIAAGLVSLSWAQDDGTEAWRQTFEQFTAYAPERDDRERAVRHFVTWEAEWLASRAIEEAHRNLWDDEVAHIASARRAADLARLTRLEREGGGWACDEGIGDAYFTALACSILAE